MITIMLLEQLSSSILSVTTEKKARKVRVDQLSKPHPFCGRVRGGVDARGRDE